ncbi:IclR family transcriptional regulator, partial [Virgibacillus halodenitrificans]|nr:IclR family transcriptional regulator [Virgibacillus halodenitrificans]
AEEINEVIHLVIVNGSEATYIEKVESTRALRLYTRIGKSSPLHAGSGPKLLLAFLPKEKQDEILSKSELGSITNKPISVEKLREELRTIRNTGYSYSIGEQDADTTGISYPIYDYSNKVIAALAVSGLSSHFEGENLNKLKEKASQTAVYISEELGYRKG